MPRQHLTAVVGADTRQFNRAMGSIRGSVGKLGRAFGGVGAALGLGGIGATLGMIAKKSIQASADIETLEVSLEGLVGGKSAAKAVVEQLKQFSAATPFQLEDIGKSAKQLLAAGVGVDELRGQLKVVGDIAAGANVPLSDMSKIYTKIRNKGKASLEELNPIAERGIPIFDLLAKKLGVTREQIFKMATAGQISRNIIDSVFSDMSGSGGMFADQMSKQSQTINGKISTLKDTITLLGAAIGDMMVGDTRDAIDSMISGISEFAKSDKMESIVSGINVLRVALSALLIVVKGLFALGEFFGGPIGEMISGSGVTKGGMDYNQLSSGTGQFGATGPGSAEVVLARLEMMARNGVAVVPVGGAM